ncbi:MAG: hypothetical protein WDN45_02990 [Caulobacteraceae bacterium]
MQPPDAPEAGPTPMCRPRPPANPPWVPLAKGASYAENDQVMDVGKGVLASPLKVDFTRSFLDHHAVRHLHRGGGRHRPPTPT